YFQRPGGRTGDGEGRGQGGRQHSGRPLPRAGEASKARRQEPERRPPGRAAPLAPRPSAGRARAGVRGGLPAEAREPGRGAGGRGRGRAPPGRRRLVMRRGELWWADLPAPAGRRPVVLLSRDEAYLVRRLVTVAPITTRVRRIPTEVALGPDAGLPKAGV